MEALFEGAAGLFQGPQMTPAKLLNMTPLAPQVQKHLSKVYTTLFVSLGLVVLGCTTTQYLMGGAIPTIISVAGVLGCSIALMLTEATPETLNKRYTLLAGYSVCQGASLTPLIAAANLVSPSIVLTAVLATAAIFGCFSLSALTTTRRSFFFLSSILASAVAIMLVMSLGSLFFGRSNFSFTVELYVGLLVFSGYILVDTQMIVEKAYAGDFNHVRHALDLLTDLIAVFVRVLIIIMKNKQRQEEERARNRNKKRSQRD